MQGTRSIKTSTFVAALRSSGIAAPFVIDGAINGRVSRTYVEEVLTLRLAEGVVVIDNLGAHKIESIRQTIEARSASDPWAKISTLLDDFSPKNAKTTSPTADIATDREIALERDEMDLNRWGIPFFWRM